MSNYSIGYEGKCNRCDATHRIYYFFADKLHKQMMIDGTIMQERSNCPICVTSKLIQTPHTMKWLRKLSPQNVETDLTKMNGGIRIDFGEVNRQMKQNEKNDEWLANNERRVAEKLEWSRKTEGGIQKRTSR